MEEIGIHAVLRPLLAAADAPPWAPALEEELVAFLSRRGLRVEEEGGRRIAGLAIGRFDPDRAWAFVADHLAARCSRPLEELVAIGTLLATALRQAAGRGLADPASAAAAEAAVAELPRLDGLAKALRAPLQEGRPGRDLWERDPEAYARAMQRWESAQPLAREKLEGGFAVEEVQAATLLLRHPAREEAIELAVRPAAARLARPGDRLDVQLGRNGSGWFLTDVFATAAPRRTQP